MQNEYLQSYVNNLIKDSGGDSMPSEKLNEYRDQVMALVQKQLGITMMKEMSDADIDEYIDLIEKKPTSDQLQQFFNERIENFDDKVKTALEKFRSEFLASGEAFESVSE